MFLEFQIEGKNATRFNPAVPPMALFNKIPIQMNANTMLKGNKTSANGLYRSATKEVFLYDKNNPDGSSVGKIKLQFIQLRK